MKTALTLAALVVVGAAAYAPTASQAQPHVAVYIGSAPPAPIYERVPGPRHGHVWAPGYWEWRGHRHAWVPGHYVVARPGYVYAAPRWQQRQGRWYMEPSRWDRGGPHGHRPVHGGYRDHDRYDRHDRHDYRGHGGRRDNDRDGVPNHRDRDRDGDGVSNRHDRRPDNPRRD